MLIDYQNVSIYQADKCVLQNINFHIDEGEFAYLIGKVGSGKSSLLKTLYCELDLVEGETEKAEILGRDLKTIRRKEIPALRKELGIIFQDFQLLHDRTVRKNFEFVLKATGWKNKKDREKRIEDTIAMALAATVVKRKAMAATSRMAIMAKRRLPSITPNQKKRKVTRMVTSEPIAIILKEMSRWVRFTFSLALILI